MEKYNKKKWRYVGTIETKDIWGNTIEKSDYRMTNGYKKYLTRKDIFKKFEDVQTLYNKMCYQKELYGEADDIEYSEYLYRVKDFKKWLLYTSNDFTETEIKEMIHSICLSYEQ